MDTSGSARKRRIVIVAVLTIFAVAGAAALAIGGLPDDSVGRIDTARKAGATERSTHIRTGEPDNQADSTMNPPTSAPPEEPAPEASNFPNENTTGVPAGTELKPSDGLTITEDGTVIDGLDIEGTVKVEANDVTIKNSRITSTGRYAIDIERDAKNLVVEDTEIDGNEVTTIAILRGEFTLRRVNIHNVQDGPRIEGDNVLIENSYIHDLHRVDGGHHDVLQMRSGSNVVVRDNNLQAYNAETDDPMNAAMQFGSETSPITDVLFEGNLMNGGNYTINCGDVSGESLVFRDNRFGRDFRYGVVSGASGITWEPTNVYHDTGEPVT